MSRFRTILMVGAPGSGKGTQGAILGKLPGFFHCACGNVFRALDLRTSVGRAFLEFSSKGQLVPDEITVDLWMASLRAAVENHRFKPEIDCLVLDGIPRNARQAKLMDPYLEVETVFHLVCADREKLVARMQKRALKDNRIDDASEDVIRQRLDLHDATESALLGHYPRELIRLVDACEPAHRVLHQILQVIVAPGRTNGPRMNAKATSN